MRPVSASTFAIRGGVSAGSTLQTTFLGARAPLTAMDSSDVQHELQQVEARINSLVKERASLQHALNTPAIPQLSPEEARAERLVAQQKEVKRFEQQVAHSKEALAKRQRDLEILLVDDRTRLADEVALGADAYYGETRKMRQALHEQQQQQQQLGGAAGAGQAMRARRLRQEEVQAKGEVAHARQELVALQDQEKLVEEQTREVLRLLAIAEQEASLVALRETEQTAAPDLLGEVITGHVY